MCCIGAFSYGVELRVECTLPLEWGRGLSQDLGSVGVEIHGAMLGVSIPGVILGVAFAEFSDSFFELRLT